MKMGRIIKTGGKALLLFLLLALFTVYLFISTEFGSRLITTKVVESLNKQDSLSLATGRVSGTLLAGLSFSNLFVEIEGESHLTLAIDQIDLRWNLAALLSQHIELTQVLVQTLNINISIDSEADNDRTDDATFDIATIIAPLFEQQYSISLANGSISNLNYINGAQEINLDVSQLAFISNPQTISIPLIDVELGDLRLNGRDLLLQKDQSLAGQLLWGLSTDSIDYEGELSLAGNINVLEVQHNLLNPVLLNSLGEVQPFSVNGGEPEFSFVHQIESLKDFSMLPAWLQEVSGEVRTEGVLENFSYDAMLQISVEQQPTITANVKGQRQGDSWQGQWSINENQLFELPADISVDQPSSAGSYQLSLDDGVQGHLLLTQFSALVNEVALEVQGEVNIVDSSVEQVSFDLVQGQNSFHAQGTISEQIDLIFSADVPIIGSVVPILSGDVKAQGSLTGSINEPNVVASLQSNNLLINNSQVSMQSINVDVRGNAAEMLFNVALQNVKQGEKRLLSDAKISLQGELNSHSYSIDVISEYGSAVISGEGQWLSDGWVTQINKAETLSDYGDWLLESSGTQIEFNLEDQLLSIEQQCWLNFNLRLCLEGQGSITGEKSVELSLHNLPLKWAEKGAVTETQKPEALSQFQESIQFYAPENVSVDGELEAYAELKQITSEDDWQFEVAVAAGQLKLDIASENELPSRAYQIDYSSLVLSKLLEQWSMQGQLQVFEERNSGLILGGTVTSELNIKVSSELSGNITFALPSLAFIEALLPQFDEPEGELNGSIVLSGQLDRPILESQINLVNGRFGLPEYGINISELTIDLNSDDANNISLEANGLSGPGQITLQAQIQTPFLPGRSAQLEIQGDNFEMMNLPDRTMSISPALTINASQEEIILKGNIVVPAFYLVLEDEIILNNSITESSDVYIIEADDVRDEAEVLGLSDYKRIPIQGEINVILGDDIRFQGYGLDVQLEGELALEKSLNRPLLSYGELRVREGSYTLYGQTLTSESGQLMFFGNASNPALNVRVVREVDETTVGMHLNGTLNNIQGQLFSTPILPESEILAMLISGKSFAKVDDDEGNSMLSTIVNLGIERGQGLTNTVQDKLGLDSVSISTGDDLQDSSIGIGKYLSPELFVSYEMGLFDRESVLNLNYFLTEHLNLEVESGISQSIGLTYTIEK